jgi:cytochrome P450
MGLLGRDQPASLEPRDLYSFYRAAREEQPVYFSASWGMWVVTRYDDVLTVLKDSARFQKRVNTPQSQLIPEAAEVVAQIAMTPVFDTNPPDHTRIRRFINRAFTAQRVNRMEPRIRAIAHRLVDEFEGHGAAEIIHEYCFPLPASSIFELVGVPQEDLEQVGSQWATAFVELFFSSVEPERQVECARANLDYWNYCVALIEERRKQPGDDLIGQLLTPTDDGDAPLTTEEIVSLCATMVVAGHENTTRTIASALLFLLDDRDRWNRLVAEPRLAIAATEETLRCEPSLNGLWYFTTEDVELGGAVIPKDALVFASFASANHDDKYFADADAWNMDRTDSAKHLTFGAGIHVCFGASLARLTGRVALEVLAERLPTLRMTPQDLTYLPMFVTRGVERLEVAWDR